MLVPRDITRSDEVLFIYNDDEIYTKPLPIPMLPTHFGLEPLLLTWINFNSSMDK